MIDYKQEISKEVKDAAKAYAKRTWPAWFTREQIANASFIAGALYSKPFEHNAKPEDKNVKQ